MGEYAVKNEFLVMPADTNDLYPLIFGGALYSQMDKAAAIVARKYLADTQISHAVTHTSNIVYKKPSYSGDVLQIRADVQSANVKSIVIKVDVWRDDQIIAEGEFVFVAIKNIELIRQRPAFLVYTNHNKPLIKD